MAFTTLLRNEKLFQLFLVLLSAGLAWLGNAYGNDQVPLAEKRLEYSTFAVPNPLQDLTVEGSDLSVSVRSNGLEIENVGIVHARIENTGHAHILRSDFDGPLVIRSKDGWDILSVVNDDGYAIKPVWSRVGADTFSAQPFLINAGDVFGATIFLTRQSPIQVPEELGYSAALPIEFNARILGLSGITPQDFSGSLLGPIYVQHRFISLLFFLATFILFCFWTVKYITNSAMLAKNKAGKFLAVLCLTSTLLMVEGVTNYALGIDANYYVLPETWINLPLILQGIIMYSALLMKAKSGGRPE